MKILDHYLDAAVVADLQRRLDRPDLVAWLDEEADRLSTRSRGSTGRVWFSYALMEERNIVEIRADLSRIGEHARLLHTSNGYEIHYRQDVPMERYRFAIAHEVGHTYFLRRDGGPVSPLQSSASGVETIENLCDFFAGALLLPRSHLLNLVGEELSGIPPLHRVPELANRYLVADQAVARRLLFQLFPRMMAVIRLRRPRPSSAAHLVDAVPKARTTKRHPARSWTVSWCAVPWQLRRSNLSLGIRIPLLSNRAIPDEMVPRLSTSSTVLQKLDGRWWTGLEAEPLYDAQVSFRRRPTQNERDGFIFRSSPEFTDSDRNPSFAGIEPKAEEVAYLGLPLGQSAALFSSSSPARLAAKT